MNSTSSIARITTSLVFTAVWPIHSPTRPDRSVSTTVSEASRPSAYSLATVSGDGGLPGAWRSGEDQVTAELRGRQAPLGAHQPGAHLRRSNIGA